MLLLLFSRSLYIFFMQAKSYSEVQDSSVVVSISGDIGEARAFQSQQDNSGKQMDRAGVGPSCDSVPLVNKMMIVETRTMREVKSEEG
jgi:hypothetical protein